MSAWKPGLPVLTPADEVAWRLWRAESRREQQRARRSRNPRIDYYPDKEALRALQMVWQPRKAGHDLSSSLNAIAADWLRLRGV